MPENEKKSNLLGELVVCSRCKNPFMGKPIEGQELVCDNCIKLEERKKELELGVLDNVIESNKQMDKCIIKMKDCLSVEEKQYSKQDYLNSIKKRAQTLTKSIDLLEKIDETQDEAYIEEYKKMFLDMRKEQNEKK
jgi:hypothetical protein